MYNNANSGHSYLASEGTYSLSIGGHSKDWIVQLVEEEATIAEPTKEVIEVIGEKISLLVFDISDESWDRVNSLSVGDLPVFESTLKNNVNGDQKFVYFMEIKDARGITVNFSYLVGEMPKGKVLGIGLSWMPDAKGEYTVDVFVWDDLENPNPLAFRTLSKRVIIS